MSLNCLAVAHRKIESVIFSNQLFKAFDMQAQAKRQTFALELQYHSNENVDYEDWQAEQSIRVDALIESLQAAGKNIDGPWVVLLEANYGQPAKSVFCQVLFEALQAKFPDGFFVFTSTTKESLESGLEVFESVEEPARLLAMNPLKKDDEEDANPNILTRTQAMSQLEALLRPAMGVIFEGVSLAQDIEQMPPDLEAASNTPIVCSTKTVGIKRRHRSDIARSFASKGKDGKGKKSLIEEGDTAKASGAAPSIDEEAVQLSARQRLLSQYKTTNKGKRPEVISLAGESPDENNVVNDAPAGPSGRQPSPSTKSNGPHAKLR